MLFNCTDSVIGSNFAILGAELENGLIASKLEQAVNKASYKIKAKCEKDFLLIKQELFKFLARFPSPLTPLPKGEGNRISVFPPTKLRPLRRR